MRLPFSLHRSTKSTDGFLQLSGAAGQSQGAAGQSQGAAGQPQGADDAGALAAPRPPKGVPGSSLASGAGRDRGASVGSSASSISVVPLRNPRAARPTSVVFGQNPAPPADMHMAQMEEELDTIMDGMGLLGDQRMAMKNMPIDRKIQLIHTHKASRGGVRPEATPLSEHLKILARAGTQSLPLARLEKLRVDVSYQTIDQIGVFIEGGGVRLLLTHLVQLNERRAATRRTDELQKELEILRCILGIAKVPAGAKSLVESTTNVSRVLDSLSTQWMPCSIMCLRIASVLVHHDDPQCASTAIAALFRSEAASKRRPAFADWMETIDTAFGGFEASDPLARADIVECMTSSLSLVNSVIDALAPAIDKRVKFYERLAAHDMLAKLAGLRAWGVSVVNSHLNRWDEVLRRDYNIARTQRPDAAEPGTAAAAAAAADSAARNATLFRSFVVHYEEAKAAVAAAARDRSPSDSGDDDGYLQMNLSTCLPQNSGIAVGAAGATTGTAAGSALPVTVSAPATPAAGALPRGGTGETTCGPSTNPFFVASNVRAMPPAEPINAASVVPRHQPLDAPSWGRSSIVAETGSLRSLRSPKEAPALLPAGNQADEPLANIKSAHTLLQKSLTDPARLTKNASDEACRDLQSIVQLAQSLLTTLGRNAA